MVKSLLLRVSVDAHEQHGGGGSLVDDVYEGEIGDEPARFRGPRRTEPEDGGGCCRYRTWEHVPYRY